MTESSPSPRSGSPAVVPSIPTATATSTAASTAHFVPPWRRPTLAGSALDGASHARRPSVQFVPHIKGFTGSRSSSARPPSVRRSLGGATPSAPGRTRRLSSPPPPAQFRPKVSFDTFSNPAASDFSLTLNRKHRDYEYTKRSRTFLCGTDTNDYSDTALEWLIDELVDDGDEVVCLRVVEKDSKEAINWSRGEGNRGYHREANRFLEEIEKKNTDDRAISLVLEFSIGKVQDTIQQMIRIYEPAILVVGTRGKSLTGYQGLLSSGSVSKYCLQYSPVPVIVVRPSSKREAKKRKRLQDPARSGYRDILDKSEDAPRGRGGHLLDANNRLSLFGSDLGALGELDSLGKPDDEARRVAEAIGYRNGRDHPAAAHARTSSRGSSLSRITSARSEANNGNDNITRLLRSPEVPAGAVDSPTNSDDENPDDYDDDDDGEELRPEDEAAQLAYERAQTITEELRDEAKERTKRAASRTGRRGTGGSERGEGGGSAVLDILAKLDRGLS